MASYIERGESVFFQFRNGKSVLNSQCKPRMFKTAEKATLGVNYIGTDEIVEYSEVVRCEDCKHWRHETQERIEHYECDIFCGAYGRGYPTHADDFCSYGERREENATD